MKIVPKLYDIRSFGILAFRIRWTDFHNLHQMKAFWVQMIDLDLFFDISKDVAMATNFGQNL